MIFIFSTLYIFTSFIYMLHAIWALCHCNVCVLIHIYLLFGYWHWLYDCLPLHVTVDWLLSCFCTLLLLAWIDHTILFLVKWFSLWPSIFLASAECFLNRLLFFFMGFYVCELWILIINMQNLHVTLWYTIWELQNCMIISHLIIFIKTFTIKVILYRSCPNHIITYILYNESWILKVVVATSGYP